MSRAADDDDGGVVRGLDSTGVSVRDPGRLEQRCTTSSFSLSLSQERDQSRSRTAVGRLVHSCCSIVWTSRPRRATRRWYNRSVMRTSKLRARSFSPSHALALSRAVTNFFFAVYPVKKTSSMAKKARKTF